MKTRTENTDQEDTRGRVEAGSGFAGPHLQCAFRLASRNRFAGSSHATRKPRYAPSPLPEGEGAGFQAREFAFARHPDQDTAPPTRRPVVIVGAGPVGLALAIDLAQRGIPVVLLDDDHRLSTGSRAICFAKRTLEIFDRLGCGDRMVAKGVS